MSFFLPNYNPLNLNVTIFINLHRINDKFEFKILSAFINIEYLHKINNLINISWSYLKKNQKTHFTHVLPFMKEARWSTHYPSSYSELFLNLEVIIFCPYFSTHLYTELFFSKILIKSYRYNANDHSSFLKCFQYFSLQRAIKF